LNSDIYSEIYFDDEDEQLTDEEFEELIEFVEKRREKYLNRKRINQISRELSDQLFIEFLMLDEETRNQLKNMTNEEYTDIQKSLYNRRKHLGGCSMWRQVGVKYLGDRKKWDQMYDWEKEYYNKVHKHNKSNKQYE
tara:strand:+ start:174 stop:584 length:411 start_codon:yes stop_codon:yes gene_type:complete